MSEQLSKADQQVVADEAAAQARSDQAVADASTAKTKERDIRGSWNEQCWLIERTTIEGQHPTVYWRGENEPDDLVYQGRWTESPWRAKRFDNPKDAEYESMHGRPCHVAEHSFAGRATQGEQK